LLPEKNWTRWFYKKGKIALRRNKQATFQAVLKSAKRKSLQFWHFSRAGLWRFHMKSWSFWFFVQILGFCGWTHEIAAAPAGAVSREPRLLIIGSADLTRTRPIGDMRES
jgi:hypothetical protein